MRTLVFLCLFASATAHAQLVTLDAQDYATGTNLVGVVPGVKVTTVTNQGTGNSYAIQSVFAIANTWATGVGPNLFGHANANPLVLPWDFRNLSGLNSCWNYGNCSDSSVGFFNPLRANFAVPTNYVEIRVHFQQDDIDGADLRAYNSAGDLLMTCHFFGDVPGSHPKYKGTSTSCGELIRRYECNSSGTHCKSEHLGRIKRKYPDIAYVLYGGEAESATNAGASALTFRRYSEDCAK